MSPEGRPRLRGVLHHWAALVALGAGLVLVVMAPTARAAWAAGVYAFSVVILFGVSAAYHRPTWPPRIYLWMKRIDHAAIGVLIAGTYTPLCLLLLPESLGSPLLIAAWLTAGLIAVRAIGWPRAPKWIAVGLYLAQGWLVVPFSGTVWAATSGLQFAELAGGGLAYTVGAFIYAVKRPDPFPRVFGYHELFHALTILACGLHFALVLSVVRSAV